MRTTTTAQGLLAQLDQQNVLVFAEGDKLMVKGSLAGWQRERLIEMKPEILLIAPRRRWRVTPPGRPSFGVDCARVPMSREELRGIWPDAEIEPAS